MKKYIFIACIILCSIYACNCSKKANATSYQYQTSDKTDNLYQIYKIDSLENLYVIYLKKTNSIFKVVSDKQSNKICNKIKVGQSYDLKIKSVIPSNLSQKNHIAGFMYSGTLVKLKGENTVWDLFVSENLTGLCYNPDGYTNKK